MTTYNPVTPIATAAPSDSTNRRRGRSSTPTTTTPMTRPSQTRDTAAPTSATPTDAVTTTLHGIGRLVGMPADAHGFSRTGADAAPSPAGGTGGTVGTPPRRRRRPSPKAS